MNKVLNFHSVKSGHWFEHIICYLKSRTELITADNLAEFYNGRSDNKSLCHLTIDDGDLSFYHILYPILKKYKIPATLFVSPRICTEKSNFWFQEVEGYDQLALKKIIAGYTNIPLQAIVNYHTDSILKCFAIGQIHEIIRLYRKKNNTPEKTFQNMTIENLKEVFRSEIITIGAHTLNHPILHNEDNSTSKSEIMDSIAGLSDILNTEIRYFSYPNGIPLLDFTEREMNYLKESKVRLAFTTKSTSIGKSPDKTCIPRMGISDRESMLFFKTKMLLDSHWDKLTRIKPNGEYKQRSKLLHIIPKFQIEQIPQP